KIRDSEDEKIFVLPAVFHKPRFWLPLLPVNMLNLYWLIISYMYRERSIKRLTCLLQIIMFLLAAIGIAMVIRRTLVLASLIPSVNPAGGPPFDTGFSRHPALT